MLGQADYVETKLEDKKHSFRNNLGVDYLPSTPAPAKEHVKGEEDNNLGVDCQPSTPAPAKEHVIGEGNDKPPSADEDDDVETMLESMKLVGLPPLLTGMLEEQLMSSCLTVTFLFIEDSLV